MFFNKLFTLQKDCFIGMTQINKSFYLRSVDGSKLRNDVTSCSGRDRTSEWVPNITERVSECKSRRKTKKLKSVVHFSDVNFEILRI